MLVDVGHRMPCAVPVETAAGGDGVDMRMPAQIRGGGVDGCHHARPGPWRRSCDQLRHRLVGGALQLAEQRAPMQEVGAQELRQRERPKAVADVLHHLLAQEDSQDGTAFGVAARADAAAGTGEGDQVLVLAGVADHSREAPLEDAAVEKGVHRIIETPAPAAIRPLETHLPRGLDRVVDLLDQRVERGRLRSARPIDARAWRCQGREPPLP